MIEAMMPKGISKAEMVRESRSMSSKNIPPKINADGSNQRLSEPMRNAQYEALPAYPSYESRDWNYGSGE